MKAQTRIGRTGSFLLGVVAMAATACGTYSLPMASYGSAYTPMTSNYAAGATTPRKFGLKITSRSRRLKYVAPRRDDALPASVDLRSQCTPIADQGQIGSCTAFCWGKGMAEFIAKKNGVSTSLSPLFLYVEELKIEGHLGQDEGAEMATGGKVLLELGDSPEADWPYLTPAAQMNPAKIQKALSTLPSDKAVADAAAFKVHATTPVANLAELKAALAKGQPVAMGVMVYDSFMRPRNGVVPVPDTGKEKLLGGHAVLAVGYDDAKQQVIMRNSWGTGWGDKGWFYLPYGFIKDDLVMDCFTAN